MRLAIAFPTSWLVTHESSGRARAIVPGHEGPPDLIVEVSAIEAAPPKLDDGNVAHLVGSGMSSNSTLRVQQIGEVKAATNRPVTLVRVGVHDPSGDQVEQRLAAIYDLGHYVATVLVIGRDAARWNALVRSLEYVVLGAVLDWSGPPACLADILGVDRENAVFHQSKSRVE